MAQTPALRRIDLHIHTEYSKTSEVTVEKLAAFIRDHQLPMATVTDFGTIRACRELRELVDCPVFTGVEVRAPQGDFLVFSTDEGYLDDLPATIGGVAELRHDEETAVIWAHPFVNQRAKSYEVIGLPEVESVLPDVDGIELFNGTMISLHQQNLLRPGYFQNLMRIASDMGLVMTGGSDAHEPQVLGRCFTSFLEEIADAASLVAALKGCRAIPGYDHEFFGVSIPLG